MILAIQGAIELGQQYVLVEPARTALSQSESLRLSTVLSIVMPALLIRMSSEPCSAITSATTRRQSSPTPMLPWWIDPLTPSAIRNGRGDGDEPGCSWPGGWPNASARCAWASLCVAATAVAVVASQVLGAESGFWTWCCVAILDLASCLVRHDPVDVRLWGRRRRRALRGQRHHARAHASRSARPSGSPSWSWCWARSLGRSVLGVALFSPADASSAMFAGDGRRPPAWPPSRARRRPRPDGDDARRRRRGRRPRPPPAARVR